MSIAEWQQGLDIPAAPVPRPKLVERIDLAIIVLVAALMCVYRIGDYSFGGGDQTTHSLVVQNFVKGGDLLHPEYGGKPYYNKPPFKMWLAAAAVGLLGESNFSYRLVDGLCGVAISVLLFAFVRRAFRSRLAAYLAVLALLGCDLFFFGHGVRNAVQDSMMVCLVTAALVTGWSAAERFIAQEAWAGMRSRRSLPTASMQMARTGSSTLYLPALTIGLLSGLAVLTKNIPGLIGLMVLGIYAVCTPSLRRHFRRLILPGLLGIVTALVPFGLFLLAQGDRLVNAWGMMIRHELVKRATVGYHNRHQPWLYFEGLFHDGLTVPPVLLVAALVYGVVRFALKRERALGLLLIWAVLPVVLFSTARSKLMWYVLPAVPAFAALTGLTLAALLLTALEPSRTELKRPARIALGFLAVCGVLLLGRNVGLIAEKNLKPKVRAAVDLLAEDVLRTAEENNGIAAPHLVRVLPAKTAKHEDLYLGMLPQRGSTTVSELPAVLRSRPQGETTLVSFPLTELEPVTREFRFRSYALLPPIYRRRQWLTLLSDSPRVPAGMAPASEEIDLSRLGARAMFGWKFPLEALGKRLAGSRGESSGILLDGDILRTTFGTDLELFLASLMPAAQGTLTLDVTLNGTRVGTLEGIREGFQLRAVRVPPGAWKRGKNALVFGYRRSDGRAIDAQEEIVLAETLTVRIGDGRALD